MHKQYHEHEGLLPVSCSRTRVHCVRRSLCGPLETPGGANFAAPIAIEWQLCGVLRVLQGLQRETTKQFNYYIGQVRGAGEIA